MLFIFSSGISQISFDHETIDHIEIGYGLAIGDVDGDGKSDIILADKHTFQWYKNPTWERYVMIENLTQRDNVCLAVRDIDGDGMVEIAVGAQWNPGETIDEEASGSVHYLIRPNDPRQKWDAVQLAHEPTVHRMGWVKTPDGFHLLVVPLHGRGNKQGVGMGVRIYTYPFPNQPEGVWDRILVDSSMHLTHNFDLVESADGEDILVGGKEGASLFRFGEGRWTRVQDSKLSVGQELGFGEIRHVQGRVAGVQPLHGNRLSVFGHDGQLVVLTEDLNQGHALAWADLIGTGNSQIIVGWREKDPDGNVGIKLFRQEGDGWKDYWIDENGMACEDLKIYDLDGDGKSEIIASGRSTKNLKIYWNQN